MGYGWDGYHILVGPPGTGKTTMLAEIVREIVGRAEAATIQGESPVLLCSMTRAARREIESRGLPVHPDAVATLHAHCWRAQGLPPVISAADVTEEWNKRHSEYALTPDGFSRNNIDLDVGRPRKMPGDEFSDLYHLFRHRMIDRGDWSPNLIEFADKWEEWKGQIGKIDFTDMIDNAPPVPPMNPSVILADEAQDLSLLELKVLGDWGKSAGALICAGDPNQSLYNFRGAQPHYLTPDNASTPGKYRVLRQSYRVPRQVHAVAMAWIRQVKEYKTEEYRPRNEEGFVNHFHGSLTSLNHAVDIAEEHTANNKTVMFAVSCNYMASLIVGRLRSRAVPFSNPWRQKNGMWNPLGRRRGVTTIDRLDGFLSPIHSGNLWNLTQIKNWTDATRTQGDKTIKPRAKAAISQVYDSSSAEERSRQVGFNEMLSWFGPEYTTELMSACDPPDTKRMTNWIKPRLLRKFVKPFSYPMTIAEKRGLAALTEPPKVFVGTCHSFKGAEADIVFLFPDLSMAGYDAYQSFGENFNGVIRTFYVGMTRSREGLYLCRVSSKWGVRWQGI